MSIDNIGEIVIRVAKQEIMPRFKNLAQADITAKSKGELVTIADIAAENALSKKLLQLFPKAIIGGEESIAKTPALLKAVISADHAFLIDPVDGTNNFIKDDKRFSVMMTELRKSEAVSACIYLTAIDKICTAEKGAGAYISGKKIKIRNRKSDPAHMVGAAHINRFPENLRTIARENLKKICQNRPAFCAGYDYISLVEGSKDFSVYYRTLPWDHMPGSLIFAEAGGYVRTLYDEQDYTIHHQNKGLLSASNKEQWHSIRHIIFPNFSADH